MSKPHSEVASVTHTHALKGFRKGASLFSGFAQAGGTSTNAGFRREGERGTSPQTCGHISQLRKGSVSPLKIPSHPTFEIPYLLVGTPGRMNPENRGAFFRKRFSTEGWVVEATSECGLEELKICRYALNWASELSETKASCPMLSFAFSVLADFLVLLASWSGADASHTSALNTSLTHLLRGFRTF